MATPMFYVDFNEMLEPNLVLLSAGDTRAATDGSIVTLSDGIEVTLYMDDSDQHGNPDHLIAAGVVEASLSSEWAAHVKWCCRINADGIRHESELR